LKVDFISTAIDQGDQLMKDPDLRFNILTAAALGVVIVLGPTAARVAADEASGRHVGADVGQSDVDTVQRTLSEHLGIRGEWEKFTNVGNSVPGQNDTQMWTVGLNYKF
jgi:hypothetical protein